MTLKYGKKKGSKFQLINGNERNGSWRNEKKWRFDPIVGTQKPQVYIMRDRINMLNTLFSRSFFFCSFRRERRMSTHLPIYIFMEILFFRDVLFLWLSHRFYFIFDWIYAKDESFDLQAWRSIIRHYFTIISYFFFLPWQWWKIIGGASIRHIAKLYTRWNTFSCIISSRTRI